MTEEEYFKIANGNKILQSRSDIPSSIDTSLQNNNITSEVINKPKRGRPKKQTQTNAIEKPIYDINRDINGKTQITARPQTTTTSKTINEINQEIQNDSLDNKISLKNKMIKEYQEELTRTQIEIDIKMKMYELYNNIVYKKQADQYRAKHNELIAKIRILNELYK